MASERFAQRTGEVKALALQPEVLEGAAPVLTEDADGMGVVKTDSRSPVRGEHFKIFDHRRYSAGNREDAVTDHKRALTRRQLAFQFARQIGCVQVAESH